jgi:mono/diheme cytochrome c family protein
MRTRHSRIALMFTAGSVALAAAISTTLAAQQSNVQTATPRATATAAGQTPARELVTTYCVSCHNPRVNAGSLALDSVDGLQVSNSADAWEKVVIKLRTRAMPPPGARRPDNATYDRVATWLETELDRAAEVHVNPGRPAELHRLNRVEYGNAVRDLLGVEIDSKAMLPADEQAHGFSTNADALSMQPALLDRYLSAAAKIARLAVGDPTMPAWFERYTALEGNSNETTWLSQNDRLRRGLSAWIARWHCRASPLSGRRRVRLQDSPGSNRHRSHPRPPVAQRHRDSRRRRASRTALGRRYA